MGLKAREEREIQVGRQAGQTFPVETPSTISVLTQFEGGQTGTSLVSFDSPLARQGIVEIHGTEGSLVVPDPNMFEGRVAYVRPFAEFGETPPTQEWIDVPQEGDRKSTRLNSSHVAISYAVFCLKKKKKKIHRSTQTTTRNLEI